MTTCYYCERKMDAAYFPNKKLYATQDHVVPKSRGGRSGHANLVTACNECNWLKSNLTLQGFIVRVTGLLNLRRPFRTITCEHYPKIISNAAKLLAQHPGT